MHVLVAFSNNSIVYIHLICFNGGQNGLQIAANQKDDERQENNTYWTYGSSLDGFMSACVSVQNGTKSQGVKHTPNISNG